MCNDSPLTVAYPHNELGQHSVTCCTGVPAAHGLHCDRGAYEPVALIRTWAVLVMHAHVLSGVSLHGK